MKVLVTGGSGFIGSHVVDKLIELGHAVRVFDMILPQRDDVEHYQGSLLELEQLRMGMAGVDVVYHLAAVANVNAVFDEPIYSESINARGTINVLEAARYNAVKRVVYGSTTWVYSNVKDSEVFEDTPLGAPNHLYTATKLVSEYYCRSYSELYDLPTTVLRYGIPYGPRARAATVGAIFVRKALAGEPLTIAGDGSQFRYFVYVEDLAEGNVLALNPSARNQIYNLDGREKITILQIAETVKKILGDVEIVHTEARPGDFTGQTVNSEKAERDLGWVPMIGFEEGMRRYVNWYQSQGAAEDVDL
jgi:UDP-glucose 4-epimerase